MEVLQSDSKPTIVLVHGAWADGTSWQHVIPLLEQNGHTVVAVQIPLSAVADDVTVTKRPRTPPPSPPTPKRPSAPRSRPIHQHLSPPPSSPTRAAISISTAPSSTLRSARMCPTPR